MFNLRISSLSVCAACFEGTFAFHLYAQCMHQFLTHMLSAHAHQFLTRMISV
jgi:hypothetical protein